MRKRFMNISKRCMVAIMSAAFLMSSVTVSMAFPVGVYALEDPNPVNSVEEVALYETLSENNGTVDHNYGTVTVNNNIVDDNRGTVVTNNHKVNENYSSVTNSSAGEVQNNYYRGSVNGEGSVTNNYAGSVEESVSVTNDYRYVALGESQGVLPSYSTGFVASPDGDQTYQFIQVKKDGSAFNGTGTLVFTPSADHKITGTEGTTFDGNDSGVAFKYNITNNADGSCSVVLSDLKGSIRVDLVTLNLLLSQIENNQINLGSIKSTADMQELIDSSDDSDTSDPSTAAVLGLVATPQLTVGGKVYKSTVSSALITQNTVIAVMTPASDIAKKAGLGAGESLYLKGWEFTAKQSPLAYKSLTDVAGSIGGSPLQCVELNFGKMKFGKFTELDESVVSRTTISLPKNANKYKKHALARAAKGGRTQILENLSEDPNVITSDIPGGAAAYAIVEY